MLRKILMRMASVVVVVLGIVIAWFGAMVIGTFIMIGGVLIWFYSSPQSFNKQVPNSRMVYGTRGVTIPVLYEALKDRDTQLGRPWIGKVRTIYGSCLIFGPDVEGTYGFVHSGWGGNTLYITTAVWGEMMIKAPQGEEWRLGDSAEDDMKYDEMIEKGLMDDKSGVESVDGSFSGTSARQGTELINMNGFLEDVYQAVQECVAMHRKKCS